MPTGNPLISQGVLNRLAASLIWTNFGSLNVTPSYLNREGISIALEGDMTRFLNAYTGRVPSPEPYVPATITLNLLKSQALSGLYKAQLESNTLLGDCTVRVDSTVHPPYGFTNCGILGVREIQINGENAGWVVTVGGTYLTNSSLWNL